MAESNVRSTGSSKEVLDSGKIGGIQRDPGPYIGTVVAHVPSTRMGQLKVSIPNFSGPTNNQTGFATVSYASPFYGKTFGTDEQDLPDSALTSGQSYGMWMVPPDIGAKVLVVFVNGDRNEGYWFACVYDGPSHHMVPGNARSIAGSNKTAIPSALSGAIGNDSNLPVAEYSTTANTAFQGDALTSTPRYAHEFQSATLIRQGLDRDKIRGAISSSSLREVPSNVYGISTPGRKGTSGNQIPNAPEAVVFRQGGHTFVMDDGADGTGIDPAGTDQLIRLRTAGGHQILMNDTEQVLYIASANGAQWIEFSSNGMLNIFAQAGYNVRTEGVMNFHSDALINFQAPAIKMNASGGKNGPTGNGLIFTTDGSMSVKSLLGASISTDGPLGLSSLSMASLSGGAACSVSSLGICSVNGSLLMLNSGPPIPGLPAAPAKTNSLQDTGLQGSTWVSVPGVLDSICTVVPAHEPWVSDDGKSRPKNKIPPSANFLGF